MLQFDVKGFLKPYNLIPSNVTEMKRIFVTEIDSDIRNEHFNNYLKYSKKIKELLGVQTLKQWINGSFITKKRNPKDIDLAIFIDYKKVNELGDILNDYKCGAWENLGLDVYIIVTYPEGHKSYKYYQSDCAYWQEKFGKTRRNKHGKRQLKGFLEIFY